MSCWKRETRGVGKGVGLRTRELHKHWLAFELELLSKTGPDFHERERERENETEKE